LIQKQFVLEYELLFKYQHPLFHVKFYQVSKSCGTYHLCILAIWNSLDIGFTTWISLLAVFIILYLSFVWKCWVG